MRNLLLRSASGFVYVGIIVGLLLWGGEVGFPLLCCLFTVLGMVEFLQITQGGLSRNPFTSTLDLFLGVSIPIMVFIALAAPQWLTFPYTFVMIGIFIFLWLVRMVMQLYSTSPKSLERMAFTIMSLVYIALPMACTVVVYRSFGPEMTLFVFVLVWLNDTGAFLVGTALGSHRLFARLSPKKSWEGFFGGMLVCIIAAWIVSGFSGIFACFPGWLYMLLACGVSILATLGDLFESMLKRNVGVKDSGNLIPGHGGILDRIDSLLFVMPGVLVLILFYIH